MKNWMTPALTILAVAAIGHVGSAQDKMAKPTGMGKEKTYTGCIAAGDMTGTYTLTHATAEMAMGKDAMKKDAMKKDTMGKDTMGKDAMAKPMAIESKAIDLAKHVGHKVSVSGPDRAMPMGKDTMGKGMAAWSVTSLKMIAGTCGM